jgi:hypothetical protein
MAYVEGKAVVPEISDSKLNELIKSIVPVVRVDGKLHNIELPDLRNASYLWTPHAIGECKDLKEFKRISTDHYCGHPSFFKPSISEVLAQIPEEDINKICAFEIIQDIDNPIDTYNYGNGHRVTTVLYRKG